jgi:hypothetical protein
MEFEKNQQNIFLWHHAVCNYVGDGKSVEEAVEMANKKFGVKWGDLIGMPEKENETYLSKLLKIAEDCKRSYTWGGDLTIEINPNRSFRQTVMEYWKSDLYHHTNSDDGDEEDCIIKGTIVVIQFYPRTPTGFHMVFAPTLEEAAKRMVEKVLS